MEPKFQPRKHNRLDNAEELIPVSLKAKEKTKERRQLWDSLLQVYEKEADKENNEDVSLLELEEWKTSYKTPSALSLVDSHIVFMSSSGLSEDIEAQQLITGKENKLRQPIKRKKKGTISINKSLTSPNSKKSKRAICLLKNKVKKQSATSNLLTETIPKNHIKQKKTKQSDTSIRLSDVRMKKNKPQTRKSTTLYREKTCSKHKSNLKVRSYSKRKLISKRPDGRVFSCKLTIRVCECGDSDFNLNF